MPTKPRCRQRLDGFVFGRGWRAWLAWAGWLVALLGGGLTASPATAQTPGQPAGAPTPFYEAIAVGVVLNGKLVGDNELVHREAAAGTVRFWLPLVQARAWRVQDAAREQRSIDGVAHAAFCVPPDRCFYDDSSALLTLNLTGSALLPLHVVPAEAPRAQPDEAASSGAFLNYDFSAWRQRKSGAALLLEGHFYNAHGHGLLRWDMVAAGGRSRRSFAAARWQIDRPEQDFSVQIGSVAVPDTAAAYGLPLVGLRAGSNPRLDPTRPRVLRPGVTVPAAERALRADVFVDGVFRQAAEVPYGPWRVEVQPTQPGRGEIDLLTTDVAGRQQRSTIAFYQAAQLLAPQAQEWSLDAGVLQGPRGGVRGRGRALVAGTLRRGLDGQTTVAGQWLVAERAARVSIGVDAAHPRWGLTSVSAVGQRVPVPTAEGARETIWLAWGHELLARGTSFAVRAERAVSGECVVPATAAAAAAAAGVAAYLARPCSRTGAALGTDIGAPNGARGSAYAAFDHQLDPWGKRSATASLGLRWQLAPQLLLDAGVQQVASGTQRARSFSIGLSFALAPRWQAQSALVRREGGGLPPAQQLRWSAYRTTPPGDADTTRDQIYGSVGPQADIGWRHSERASHFDWRAEARAHSTALHAGGGIAGAFGWADGRRFAARRIDDAFVIVDVGLPGLPVLLDNREVARTNAQGWAIVTEARAYQNNAVGVDTAALPIEYALPRDQFNVVPGLGAGALARFDLSDGGVALPLADEAGRRLPTGAPATVSTQRLPTAVTSAGEVFIDRADRAADIVVTAGARRCAARYEPGAPERTLVCRALP